MEYQIWLNGEYVARDEARIPMTDRGFRLGDVVFDTSRTFDGAVFKLRDHLDRLYRSLKYVRIDPGLGPEEMIAISEEVLARNAHLLPAVIARRSGSARSRRLPKKAPRPALSQAARPVRRSYRGPACSRATAARTPASGVRPWLAGRG